ncbi:hypothetical protein [Riemerella columbina]|uniref:hypothetical protein n=1 Tax=Riemerella columbina TaxID=103810 RepID=UPI000369113F|nr:hypothetical protein [Riemerella columbina]
MKLYFQSEPPATPRPPEAGTFENGIVYSLASTENSLAISFSYNCHLYPYIYDIVKQSFLNIKSTEEVLLINLQKLFVKVELKNRGLKLELEGRGEDFFENKKKFETILKKIKEHGTKNI